MIDVLFLFSLLVFFIGKNSEVMARAIAVGLASRHYYELFYDQQICWNRDTSIVLIEPTPFNL